MNTFLYLLSENMSDNEQEVLEDFSGMTQVNGVTISPPEDDVHIKEEINDTHNEDKIEQKVNKNIINSQPQPIAFPQADKPRFLDALKSLGTTTLIIMSLVMIFLLFVGYKYLFGGQN